MKFLKFKLNWRLLWYSVFTCLLAFVVGGTIVLPWFYIILPLVILLMTVYYLDGFAKNNTRKVRDEIFVAGLGLSIAWFLAILLFSSLEIAGFYYFNFEFYFSDFRNWFLLALVLLVPFIYSLVLGNRSGSKKKNRQVRPALN